MRDFLIERLGGARRAMAGALLLAAFAPGAALAGDRGGVLQCRLSGNDVSVLVENQTVDCVFEDDDEGLAPVHYVGKLTKIGAGATINAPSEAVWVVVAATGHVGPGALAGHYAGPNAGAKVGIGGSGALLVGGSDNTVSLQPVELEAGAGFGFNAGVESLELLYVPEYPAPRFRRRHIIRKG